MFFSFIGVVLTIQKLAFFNISKKKQLALNNHVESLRSLEWKKPSGAGSHVSAAISDNAKARKEGALHSLGNSAVPPRKNLFLSAFDNPEILARFQGDGSQNVSVQASNPTSLRSPMQKEMPSGGGPSLRSRAQPKRRLLNHDGKSQPRPSPLQGKRVAGRTEPVSSSGRTFTRTMVRRVQKTVTRSVMVPFYRSVTSILHHPVTSIVTRSILVPVIQHSIVTVNAMPFQRYLGMPPYPRVSQAPPFHPALEAADALSPAVATITRLAQPNPTSRQPEEHCEQPVKTVTRYVGPDPESRKSPAPIHPARTVTVFKSLGDQTVTLDLRESKAQDCAVEKGSVRSKTTDDRHKFSTSSVSSAVDSSEEATKSQGIPKMQSTDHSSVVSQRIDGLSNLDHVRPLSIPRKPHVDDDAGSGEYLPSSPSRSAIVLIRPVNEKSTVTITNISTITVTKGKESSSIAYSTVTVSDTSQLNDRLQELENSFKNGAENYLNLIARIIRMLEDERRTRPGLDSHIWSSEDNQKISKYLGELDARKALEQPLTERKGPAIASQCTIPYSSSSGLAPKALNTMSSITRSSIPRTLALSSNVGSSFIMSKSSKVATPKAPMHRVLRNPLLEILDLVSGSDGRSNLIDATVQKHGSAMPDTTHAISVTPSTLSRDIEQQSGHASLIRHSTSRSMEVDEGRTSPKNELLEELMKFINKDSRSEEDILKILGLIRLVKNNVPDIHTGVFSRNGVQVAKTVTIVSEDSTDPVVDASTDMSVPREEIQEASSAQVLKTITVYLTTTLSEVRTETRSHTLTVQHTVTHQETPIPRTVTVSHDVPRLETVTVKQTVTQYRTVAYRSDVHHDAIVSQRIPLATTSAVSKHQKELYILVPASTKGTTPLAETDHVIELGNSKVIEVGRPQTKGGSRSQKRKKRIRSAEITLENLSGSSPRIIDINLPVDQLRRLLEGIGQD